jgi:hypothetical protein
MPSSKSGYEIYQSSKVSSKPIAVPDPVPTNGMLLYDVFEDNYCHDKE